LKVSFAGTRYEKAPVGRTYFHEALERLKAIPGVERASAADCLPLATEGYSGGAFAIEGGPLMFAPVITVTPGYFRTLAIDMIEGREFDTHDTSESPRVVILNDAFAKNGGHHGNLAGKMLTERGTVRRWEIVGVARDIRDSGPASTSAPEVFIPLDQRPPASAAFVLRVRGNPEAYLAAARDTLRGVDRQVSVFDVRTLDDTLADTLARPRFYTTVVLFFGGLALLLALMGVYGVVCHAVAQRTHEVGVRLALGSSSCAARWLLVRNGLLPVAVGTLLGLAGALASGRLLEHLVVSAGHFEITTSVFAALALNAAAVLAMWRATRRVVHLQPMEILRSE